jgi:hypothetical protein
MGAGSFEPALPPLNIKGGENLDANAFRAEAVQRERFYA